MLGLLVAVELFEEVGLVVIVMGLPVVVRSVSLTVEVPHLACDQRSVFDHDYPGLYFHSVLPCWGDRGSSFLFVRPPSHYMGMRFSSACRSSLGVMLHNLDLITQGGPGVSCVT